MPAGLLAGTGRRNPGALLIDDAVDEPNSGGGVLEPPANERLIESIGFPDGDAKRLHDGLESRTLSL